MGKAIHIKNFRARDGHNSDDAVVYCEFDYSETPASCDVRLQAAVFLDGPADAKSGRAAHCVVIDSDAIRSYPRGDSFIPAIMDNLAKIETQRREAAREAKARRRSYESA